MTCLDKLTVDACVSPRGDLVVATHSGEPDWGTGPDGSGTLYKIRYSDKTAPQPAFAWWESPSEIRIAFDRPIPPEKLAGFSKGVHVVNGPHVLAGERFEKLRPGYEVVKRQLSEPPSETSVLGLGLLADGRTISISTQPADLALRATQ